jgi:sec-independent protein translocase protein TatA
LDPLELASIGAILLVFFLWGPQKIPELARAFGAARKEFDNATKEFQKVSSSIANGTSPLVATVNEASKQVRAVALPTNSSVVGSALPKLTTPAATGKSGDQLLLDAARQLGISTEGKTREQIQKEIIDMAWRSGSPGGSTGGQKTDPPAP